MPPCGVTGRVAGSSCYRGLDDGSIALEGGGESSACLLDLDRIDPAASSILLPTLRLHLVLVHAATTLLRAPVLNVALVVARLVGSDAVPVEERDGAEVLSATSTKIHAVNADSASCSPMRSRPVRRGQCPLEVAELYGVVVHLHDAVVEDRDEPDDERTDVHARHNRASALGLPPFARSIARGR